MQRTTPSFKPLSKSGNGGKKSSHEKLPRLITAKWGRALSAVTVEDESGIDETHNHSLWASIYAMLSMRYSMHCCR